MTAAKQPEPQSPLALTGDALHANPRTEWYFRLLLSLAAMGTLFQVATWQSFTQHHFFILVWLLYPHGVYLAATRYFDQREADVTYYAGFADAALVGILIGILDFTLLPACMFFTVIQSQALLNQGVRHWAKIVGTVAVGFLVSLIFHRQQWHWESNAALSLPSMIGVSIYFGLFSFFMYGRRVNLELQVNKASTEYQDLRMKMWKLSRYVSPQIWRTIFAGREVRLETSRKRLTVFFSDIKGFTELSEQLEAEQMTDMLNHYLSEMSQIIHKYGGTIDKFIGDAIMVFFGDPTTRGAQADCLAAVSMSIEMRKHMRIMQQHWLNQGIEVPLEIRMGVNTGYCTVGNFGTEQRLDYTVLGTAVNLASRLESAAPPGEILVSHETYSLIKDTIACEDKGLVKVKGISQPVRVYLVQDLRKNIGDKQTYLEQRADGFSMHLDIDKVKNYDKDRIIKSLLNAATRVKNQVKD